MEPRPLESFLVELTAKVCRVIDPETKQPLVDVVLDKAGQKGTGKWTAQVALDLGVADPDDRRGARRARALEPEGRARRRLASSSAAADAGRGVRVGPSRSRWSTTCATRCTRRGSAATRRAWRSSRAGSAEIRLERSTWRRWRASGRAAASSARGCSTRCARRSTAQPRPARTCWSIRRSATDIAAAQAGWRRDDRRAAAASGIPVPALSVGARRTSTATAPPRLPQNLTQAQRDAFGAHTYERVERPGFVHATGTRRSCGSSVSFTGAPRDSPGGNRMIRNQMPPSPKPDLL